MKKKPPQKGRPTEGGHPTAGHTKRRRTIVHSTGQTVQPQGAYPLQTPPEKIQFLQGIQRQHPGGSGPVQGQRILAGLARYPLNTYEIQRHLDCYDPPARVLALRQAGHRITTHWQTVVTEAGERHRVGLYVLGGGQP